MNAEQGLYGEVVLVLGDLASEVFAPETHGILCGMLCDPSRFLPDAWLHQVLGEDTDLRWADLAQGHALSRMLATTLRELVDQSYGMRLLLPDDDTPLAERAQALGEWCRGFLLGFGLQAASRPLSHEAKEMLQDLVNVSRLDAVEDEDDSSEFAFNDVLEYVRLGALMLHAEVREPDAETPPSLH